MANRVALTLVIDGIAIIVNGFLISDLEELQNQLSSAGYLDCTFLFIQAETSSGFDGSKIGTFGFGVSDFFRVDPKLKRDARVSPLFDISQAILDKAGKFRRGNPVCTLFYVTTGKWNSDPHLQARIDGVRSDLTETGLFRDVQFTPVGAGRIRGAGAAADPAVSRVAGSPNCPAGTSDAPRCAAFWRVQPRRNSPSPYYSVR